MNVYFANVNVHEFIGLFTEFIQIVQHNARKNLPTSFNVFYRSSYDLL